MGILPRRAHDPGRAGACFADSRCCSPRDDLARLTRAPARLNSPAMPRTNPISRLLRALSLAVMGCLLFAGTAAAHAGHASHHGQTAVPLPSGSSITSSERLAAKEPMGQAEDAMQHPGPCSEHQPADHNDDCCAVACHAALAALPVGPVLAAERRSLRLFGISRTLDGRCGDRAERPPKRI